MQESVKIAISIQQLLSENGIQNATLDRFIEEASNLPSSTNLDKYNDLVDSYNNASGYDATRTAADELINFYNANVEEFKSKANEIAKLEKTMAINDKLKALYEELASALEEEGY